MITLVVQHHPYRSWTSGADLFVVLLIQAPPSQELEPPTNPGRFAFDPEGYAPNRFSETTNSTGAREILNLEGIPNCDLRKLFADDIASRRQFGPERAVGLGVVLEEAKRSISIAEICERNSWSPQRLKWQVLPFAEARTVTDWKRDVIEGSGWLIS